jgi:hypothetical protein
VALAQVELAVQARRRFPTTAGQVVRVEIPASAERLAQRRAGLVVGLVRAVQSAALVQPVA